MMNETHGIKSQWACRLACQLIKGHHGEITEVSDISFHVSAPASVHAHALALSHNQPRPAFLL